LFYKAISLFFSALRPRAGMHWNGATKVAKQTKENFYGKTPHLFMDHSFNRIMIAKIL
jgi:hypothetical protein